MIFPDSCPSNQVELKRRECDFVGLLRCVCHQGLRDGVHSISEAEAGTRYEPQLGPVNATPFHTTLIGVIPRGRTDWIIVMQGSWGVTLGHNRGDALLSRAADPHLLLLGRPPPPRASEAESASAETWPASPARPSLFHPSRWSRQSRATPRGMKNMIAFLDCSPRGLAHMSGRAGPAVMDMMLVGRPQLHCSPPPAAPSAL